MKGNPCTKCTKCGKTSPEVEFYACPAVRKCKACWKVICNERYAKKSKDPKAMESMRVQSRARYHADLKRARGWSKAKHLRWQEEDRKRQQETPTAPRKCNVCKEIKTVCDFYVGMRHSCIVCSKKHTSVFGKTEAAKARHRIGCRTAYWKNLEKSRAKSRLHANASYQRHRNDPGFLKRQSEKQMKRFRERIASGDLRGLIASRLRIRLYDALKRDRTKRVNRTLELTGCSIEFLQKHFSSQFTEGMTWEKFAKGEIHIDHKRPCASFDLTDPEQQRQCFHYTNLQPLWEKDNLSKGAKIIT